MDQQSPEALNRAGLDALRRGDPAEARRSFESAIAQHGAAPWLALARACHELGDEEGEEQALKKQLDSDKRDLPALLAMGELKAKQADSRAANAFFRAALNVAAIRPAPPQLHAMLQRASHFIEKAKQGFADQMAAQLDSAGLSVADVSPRTRDALDLLLGKTQLFLQQPSMFYFPGLPQRQFYEREEFDWVAAIESEVSALQEELRAVIATEGEFDPYVAGSPGRPLPNNRLLNDPSWGAYYLWQSGAPVEGHADCCPKTMAAIDRAPMPVIKNRSPVALYSLLKPGTHISAHNGMLNTRLICHLPLIVPDNCALRVGSETRGWKEGKMLIFDDSIEHEAWNRSNETRIVLLFEIWRPEISETERNELTTLFEAVSLSAGSDGPDA